MAFHLTPGSVPLRRLWVERGSSEKKLSYISFISRLFLNIETKKKQRVAKM
jgi:hypothetical protein